MFEHFEDRTARLQMIKDASGYTMEIADAVPVTDKNYQSQMEENKFYLMDVVRQNVNVEYAQFYYTHFDMYEESPDPTADMDEEQKKKYEEAVSAMEKSMMENHLKSVFNDLCLVFRTGDKIEYIRFTAKDTEDLKRVAAMGLAGLDPIDAFHMAVM